jgi:glucose-6-phosphate 1-epimerase
MVPAAIAELNRQFGIPGIARVVEGNGGLAKVVVASPDAAGEMYLHGAHVTSWRPASAQEVLFLSSQSLWQDGKAIRGGIPICFPWFGGKADDAKAPAHGFVRSKAWQLESIARGGDGVTVSMFTESNAATKQWWLADFHLVHRVTYGSELTLELVLRNTGSTPLRFEEALHTYFHVGQIQKVRVQGLNGIEYLDKTDSNRRKTQQGSIEIVSETDRVYLNTPGTIELEDNSLNRHLEIAKENSANTVVWNPWIAKAHALADFGDAEWTQMICVEACNVADSTIEVSPGQQHHMKAIIRL